jgi:signal peptidase I
MASQKNNSGIVETIMTVVYAVAIAVGVRTIAFEPFNIPSGSMIPTLLIGDYLFVSKYSYGYSRYSLPFGLHLFDGRILARAPQRGDVVVFKLPSDNSTDYIKRLIGLPGDHIRMVGGVLNINGQPVQVQATNESADVNCLDFHYHTAVMKETLPNGVEHKITDHFSFGGKQMNTMEYVVPENHYFMMGDDRDCSLDSRFSRELGDSQGGVGYVPAENLVGRADLIFFSTDGSAEWWEVWKWPWATRWNRLLTRVK